MLRSKLYRVTPGKRVAADKKPVPDTEFNTAPKRLAAAIALALLAGGGNAWAAGLGRLSVQSGLGQPLRAEVEVTALTKEESASLSARLASVDAFRQAGLEYNAGCWAARFVVRRLEAISGSSNTTFFFQLELSDFASVGSNPIQLLRRTIPGYGKVNEMPTTGSLLTSQ